MNVRHLIGLTLAAVVALSASSASAVDFNGYLRSGVGGNSEGGSQVCFNLPNLPFKFRLGNECDNYAELGFGQTLYKDKATGLQLRYEGMLAYSTVEQQDFENLTQNGNQIANRQNFIMATLPNGLQVWGGKRYYHRNNVDQIDFYYWDPSGYGFGLDNVDVGFAKFAVALFRQGNGVTYVSWRPDVRLEGINVGFGSIDVGLDANYISASGSTTGQMKFSPAFTVQHKVSLLGGQNTLAVQYGQGAYAELDKYTSAGRSDKSNQFRIVENLLFQATPELSGSFVAEYEDLNQIYSNAPADKFQSWNSRTALSVGVRPAYRFNDWFKLAGEVAYQTMMGKGGTPDTNLTKVTLAPTITTPAGPGGEYLTRPELRLFVSYFGWNDAAGFGGGTAANNPFFNKTSGVTAGAQVEAWW